MYGPRIGLLRILIARERYYVIQSQRKNENNDHFWELSGVGRVSFIFSTIRCYRYYCYEIPITSATRIQRQFGVTPSMDCRLAKEKLSTKATRPRRSRDLTRVGRPSRNISSLVSPETRNERFRYDQMPVLLRGGVALLLCRQVYRKYTSLAKRELSLFDL